MTSYQRLKQRNADLQKIVVRLLDEPDYYMTAVLSRRLNQAAEKEAWRGDANTKPDGVFNGILMKTA